MAALALSREWFFSTPSHSFLPLLAKQPAQQKRNANATAPPDKSFQPKNGKNKAGGRDNPLGRSPLSFSLSLSLLPSLSRSAAHAPKLSFKAPSSAFRGWIVGGWVVNAKSIYRGRCEMVLYYRIRRSTN